MRRCRRSLWVLALICSSLPAPGQGIQSPEQFLGHQVGAEKKLARWDRIVDYLQSVARTSDRVRFEEVGKSTNGNPFVLLVISSPANLRNLDHYRDVNRRLSDPRLIDSETTGRRLIEEGKLFLLVTCSIHATEVGAAQMSMELVHRLATEDSAATRNILDNVVFLLVPCLNPDGQIIVTDWYNRNVGTPNENAPLPWLYHPYVGHDNNRDAYMFTQKETRLIGDIVFKDWKPAVWLDEHQMGSSGARIFTMPAMDPINPNVDPVIYRNAGLLGFAQAAALERAGKEGIVWGEMYTYWWEGAMAWTGWWHNIAGMLTEVASARVATTIEQLKAEPTAAPPAVSAEARRGMSRQADDGRSLPPPADVQFRSNYPRPWLGGRWSLRDIVDYELIATFGLLEAGAGLRTQLLDGLYTAATRQIEAGKKGNPYAVAIRRDQPDRPTVAKMLQVLALGGVEVHQARRGFTADGTAYAEGTYVILMAQPNRAYAKDMLEPQSYPKISPSPGQPPRPPYDVAGWSLGMQMGVETTFINGPFEADLAKLSSVELPPGKVTGKGPVYMVRPEPNNAATAMNRLLKAGHPVSRLSQGTNVDGAAFPPGTVVVSGRDLGPFMEGLAASLGIDVESAAKVPPGALTVRAPRTALYQPWGGNMDEGWTRWLLEQFEFPYTTIHPGDVRPGELTRKFDVLIFPDVSPQQILEGVTARTMPDEYRGGIEESGVKALREFVEDGGTVITLGQSCNLPMERLSAPFGDALHGLKRDEFFCPGSILRISVDPSHPLGYGMKSETGGYFINSLALEPVPTFATMQSRVVARYPPSDLLMSGWLLGEEHLQNRVAAAEVTLGKGRMVLLPLRVQHRAQTYGTFKLLFNAILGSGRE